MDDLLAVLPRLLRRPPWLYVSIVTAGYLVSRGLAKCGSRDPYTADRNDH